MKRQRRIMISVDEPVDKRTPGFLSGPGNPGLRVRLLAASVPKSPFGHVLSQRNCAPGLVLFNAHRHNGISLVLIHP